MSNMGGAKGAKGDTEPQNVPSDPTPRELAAFPRIAKWSTHLSAPAVHAISGAIGGFASGIVTCPLDVIKTKLQAQGSFARRGGAPGGMVYHGMLGTARTIIAQDGLKGMYRGLGPMVLGYIPTWAVYMTAYDAGKMYFVQKGYDKESGTEWIGQIYSAVLAGGCSTLATNPIWVIKTRFMSQISPGAQGATHTPWHYTSTFDAARKMYAAEGIKAFYSGLTPALLGLSHVAIQFPLYEFFIQKFTGLNLGESAPDSGTAKTSWGIIMASMLSKVCASTATYPHEVIRTRLQTQQRHPSPGATHSGVTTHGLGHEKEAVKAVANTDGSKYQVKYRGVIDTCKIILREEGWRAFYNGLGTNMLRAVPAAITTFYVYETVKATFDRLREEGWAIREEEAAAA